jgi:death on curing protein
MPSRRGRPSSFEQALEMAKMAWSPVLEILGSPELEAMDRIPYTLEPFHFAAGERVVSTELSRPPDPASIRWLSTSQVIEIHDRMILSFGGELGILHEGRIDSALERARHSVVYGEDQFPTILHKAASIMHDILVYHPFVDGQKRTGLASAFIFLGLNGYALWSRDPPDEVHFAVRVARGEHEVGEITAWLADRVSSPSRLGESEVDLLLARIPPRARQCHVCRRYVRTSRYKVRCANCGASYRVLIRFGAVTTTARRIPRFKATLGMVREQEPSPMTVRLDRGAHTLLSRPVRGEGGWNRLLRGLQRNLKPNGELTLGPEDVRRIRSYAEHHGVGGFQSRLAPVLEAIRREMTRERLSG